MSDAKGKVIYTKNKISVMIEIQKLLCFLLNHVIQFYFVRFFTIRNFGQFYFEFDDYLF